MLIIACSCDMVLDFLKSVRGYEEMKYRLEGMKMYLLNEHFSSNSIYKYYFHFFKGRSNRDPQWPRGNPPRSPPNKFRIRPNPTIQNTC